MPLTPEQKILKKRIYNRLKVDEPIHPDDDRYVLLYRNPDTDPVANLKEHIDLTDVESMQLFSGFRGSGKSSELFRLKDDLEEDDVFVIYANALKYINPSEELDITDLMIVVAGAFSDALEADARIGRNIQRESYWTRIKSYLINTKLDITDAAVKSEFTTPAQSVIGGLKSGIDLKLALSTTPTFRQNLQLLLANRIGELKRDVDNFIQDGVKEIKNALGQDTKVVFILDSLEQIRGSLFNEQSVIQSVERTFSQNYKLLELPSVHSIYTVPPWLKFVMPNSFTKPIIILHTIQQWHNNEDRSCFDEGHGLFKEIVLKRFGTDGLKEFFGNDDEKIYLLISYCGGSLRDLLRLLNDTLLPVQDFPVTDEGIERGINNVKSSFLPIAIDDAHWLAKIGATRKASLINTEGVNVGKLTRFLDTHFVLYFRNGEEWYDIHPLIREEVANIVAHNPLPAKNQ
ncbi:MAG: hypothetical protein ACR2MG_19610 [Pyrinomonadaceae bacterium]